MAPQCCRRYVLGQRCRWKILAAVALSSSYSRHTGSWCIPMTLAGAPDARPAALVLRKSGRLVGDWRRLRVRCQAIAAPVERMQKYIRLPVWPAWFGLVYILLDFLTGDAKLGAALEEKFGGRVCPMQLEAADPFLLCVHHRHSFNALDPFRYIFRFLLPEGFPAHPHRGFETVTYVLRGGLVHRDSFGVKKSYGAPQGADGSGKDASVQWMTAGSGLLHEEMWRTGGAFDSSDQELYQIWVNLPSRSKLVPPRMQMLRNSASAPESYPGSERCAVEVRELGPVPHAEPAPGVSVRVVAGEAAGVRSPVETYSEMAVLHVTLSAGTKWSWPRPQGWTSVVYVRSGEVNVGQPGETVPIHSTAYLSADGEAIALASGPDGADLLLLAGEPLQEPVEMAANVVMNTPSECIQARRDIFAGLFGPSWEHTEDDENWRAQVQRHWSKLKGTFQEPFRN